MARFRRRGGMRRRRRIGYSVPRGTSSYGRSRYRKMRSYRLSRGGIRL